MTDPTIAVPETPTQGIPVTYVPARNTIFLSLALAWAEVLGGAGHLVRRECRGLLGLSGLPARVHAHLRSLANLATKAAVEGRKVALHTPIIDLSKAEIIRRGAALGVDYALTVSCYQPADDGAACGRCDACRLRRAGFEAAGIADPHATPRDRAVA